MPMPKMYVEKCEEEIQRPMPYLKINASMEVVAVDESGCHLAFITDCCGYAACAYEILDRKGYATDWAVWDSQGRFVRLT
jgi:hypothetical protein